MNSETFKIILLLSTATLVGVTLHWLMGLAQRRLTLRFATEPQPADGAPSLRRLLLDWSGKALRTLVWILYAAFLINLLPQTRAQFGGVGGSLRQVGVNVVNGLAKQGVSLVFVIVGTIFLMRFASALIKTVFHLFERGAVNREALAASRRLKTLSTIIRGISQTVILFIGLMVLLSQLNINITPILASAGVLGIAIGLGAQSLIKDFFAGFLILLEDQFSVGDSVKIGENSGTVEQLTLRVTRVRGLDGSLTMIPNGSVGAVVNYSKGWSRAVLDIEIDYGEDVDRAMSVMLETAMRMREENQTLIIEDPTMLGVDKLSATSLTLRLLAKTKANKQGDVGRELRRRIKLAFDQEGIRTPSSAQQLAPLPLIVERPRDRESGRA
ncbi:MAG TPA: mechanosensitive ion channel family protein [Blastocatellia bacterium]|nr:mechanosensitive ion channel family protein [Blastocatellia bacterium]